MMLFPRICIAAALVIAATPALAQDEARAESKGHFDAGLALFKAEKYEAAALELEASVKLFPTKGGLFNLANVLKVLSRYDESLAAISRLEAEFGGKLDPEMQAAAAKMKAEMEGLAARLDIAVDPDGASVKVDGRGVGKSPLAKPVLVDPGDHVVRAELDGYAASETSVRVISRQSAKVDLELVPKGAAGAAAGPVTATGEAEPPDGPVAVEGAEATAQVGSEPGAAPERKPLPPAWFWAGLGATAAFGGVALGMDLAVRANKDGLTSGAERDRYERMQKAGIAFLALAGAAAVTTAVLAAFTEFGGGEEKPVAVGVAPNGVVFEGRF